MADTGETRAERLKAALRDNLRRRKAQERGKGQDQNGYGGAQPAQDDAPGTDARETGPDSDKTGL
jgi:hypothetical protein